MSLIVTVANQKGGVGKTTTAVNLAASFAAAERPTLLIDLDPQGNATSALGIAAQETSTYDVFIERAESGSNSSLLPVSTVEIPWLDVLPGTVDLAALERELAAFDGAYSYLRNFLRSAMRKDSEKERPILDYYDYIVIDTPPGIGLLSINALAASELLLIPVQAEYFALEGLSQMLETVDRVREHFNPDLAAVRVVTTMFDSRLRLSNAIETELRSKLPTDEALEIYKTVVPRNVRLAEAPSFGLPIILFDPASSGALAYTELSKEVIADGKAGTGARPGCAAPAEIIQ